MIAPYFEGGGVVLYHGDCLEVVPQLGVTVDAVVTDPPYGIGYDRNKKHKGSVKNILDNFLFM